MASKATNGAMVSLQHYCCIVVLSDAFLVNRHDIHAPAKGIKRGRVRKPNRQANIISGTTDRASATSRPYPTHMPYPSRAAMQDSDTLHNNNRKARVDSLSLSS